ncbi:YciI family protein [Jiangella aurantiaca]|uniref:YciI family protein n=2 Tax=Jiangella aurantiaca TaxID=2530373 RepID=A0A4R5A7U9_9ACTN|nr:YciI family protein [Jiangella aurantiaca]
MKYMLLIYNNAAAFETMSDDEKSAIFGQVDVLMKELQESGEWAGGEALVDAVRAKTVKVRDGATIVTDGPYLEAKEHLAGYLTVDVASEERALDIAARWPDASRWAMEVRQVIGG